MADTVTVIGTGGTIYEMDVPAEGTHAHERFTAQLASGDLREVRAEWVEKTYGADKDGKPLVSRHLVEITDDADEAPKAPKAPKPLTAAQQKKAEKEAAKAAEAAQAEADRAAAEADAEDDADEADAEADADTDPV